MNMRSAIIDFMYRRFSGWQHSVNIIDADRKAIAEHAADTVEKAMLETVEDCQPLVARMRAYVEREAVSAYAAKFGELLQADIEAAAQRHLLATLGPGVKALEDANAAALNPALTPVKV